MPPPGFASEPGGAPEIAAPVSYAMCEGAAMRIPAAPLSRRGYQAG